MEQYTVLHIAEAEGLEVLVEPRRFLKVMDQQRLTHPVHPNEESATDWIKYWDSG